MATVRKMMDKNMVKFLTDFTKELSPTSTLPTNTIKLYNTAVNYTSKLWPIFMSNTPNPTTNINSILFILLFRLIN